MPIVEESIVINRPCTEVWDFMSNPDNITVFNSNLAEYNSEGKGWEKGARASGVTKVAGKKVEWTSEITEVDECREVVIRAIEAPMGFELIYRFEDLGDQTKVTFRQETDSFGGFFGKLSEPIVTRMYSRDVKANLENLKVILEE